MWASRLSGLKFEDPDKPCSWPAELCRPKVAVDYKVGNEEQEFVVTWGMLEKGVIYTSVNMNTLDRAAALIAVAVWEGDEEEKERIQDRAKRGGIVMLTLDNLLATAQYDESLLEWVIRVRSYEREVNKHK